MPRDPVCSAKIYDDELEKALTSEHKSKTYYFCCKVLCKSAFDKCPEKYIPRSKEEQVKEDEIKEQAGDVK